MRDMTDNEIRNYKIPTEDVLEATQALPGYYYWHCPRCKRILDDQNGHFVGKCLNCGQVIDWSNQSNA